MLKLGPVLSTGPKLMRTPMYCPQCGHTMKKRRSIAEWIGLDEDSASQLMMVSIVFIGLVLVIGAIAIPVAIIKTQSSAKDVELAKEGYAIQERWDPNARRMVEEVVPIKKDNR